MGRITGATCSVLNLNSAAGFFLKEEFKSFETRLVTEANPAEINKAGRRVMCWKECVDNLDVVKYLRRERIEVELSFFFVIGQLLNTDGRYQSRCLYH